MKRDRPGRTGGAMGPEESVMTCEWYQRWLIASADDELVGWRDALLRRHISMCAQCSIELAELRRVRELVAGQKAHYIANLDDQDFWQQLRPHLQMPETQPTPQLEPDGELVMAYSHRQPKNLREPVGKSFFGLFSMHWMAWGAVAAVLVVTTLTGVQVLRSSRHDQVAIDIPLLPPPGQNRVDFTEVKSTKDIWASVVKFDKPDTDIAVIWVDGLPDM